MAKNEDVGSDERIAQIIAAALEKALPQMAQAAVQTAISAQQAQLSAQTLSRPSGEKCADCKQTLPAGCKQGEHKHRRVAVFPKSRKHGKWFQGVRINGVLYLSNNASHLVTVPADADIETLIKNWEENEDVLKEGRTIEHDSGSVGPGGKTNHADHNSSFR